MISKKTYMDLDSPKVMDPSGFGTLIENHSRKEKFLPIINDYLS
jgi:hypothetical protein